MTSERERFLHQVALDGVPEVYSHILVTYPVWKQYGDRLDWLEGFSPYVQVGIGRTCGRLANSEAMDAWSCRWIYPLEALDGLCVGHPVAGWDDLRTWKPPDPDAHTDWRQAEKDVRQAKAAGRVAWGGTDHGFLFLRLTYLRGFDRAMLDVAEARPELEELLDRVEGYWDGVVRRWVDLGVDAVSFGDDLGLQHSLPISPAAWRRFIKPRYMRIFSYCRSHGVYVSLHSDGYVAGIIPDLIDCGVSILNPQDLVNGLDTIARLAKGRVFVNLDIDRQRITVFGTPGQAVAHVQECVRSLGSPQGGLSFIWGVYPGTPLENVEAVARAMHQYATYWVG